MSACNNDTTTRKRQQSDLRMHSADCDASMIPPKKRLKLLAVVAAAVEEVEVEVEVVPELPEESAPEVAEDAASPRVIVTQKGEFYMCADAAEADLPKLTVKTKVILDFGTPFQQQVTVTTIDYPDEDTVHIRIPGSSGLCKELLHRNVKRKELQAMKVSCNRVQDKELNGDSIAVKHDNLTCFMMLLKFKVFKGQSYYFQIMRAFPNFYVLARLYPDYTVLTDDHRDFMCVTLDELKEAVFQAQDDSASAAGAVTAMSVFSVDVETHYLQKTEHEDTSMRACRLKYNNASLHPNQTVDLALRWRQEREWQKESSRSMFFNFRSFDRDRCVPITATADILRVNTMHQGDAQRRSVSIDGNDVPFFYENACRVRVEMVNVHVKNDNKFQEWEQQKVADSLRYFNVHAMEVALKETKAFQQKCSDLQLAMRRTNQAVPTVAEQMSLLVRKHMSHVKYNASFKDKDIVDVRVTHISDAIYYEVQSIRHSCGEEKANVVDKKFYGKFDNLCSYQTSKGEVAEYTRQQKETMDNLCKQYKVSKIHTATNVFRFTKVDRKLLTVSVKYKGEWAVCKIVDIRGPNVVLRKLKSMSEYDSCCNEEMSYNELLKNQGQNTAILKVVGIKLSKYEPLQAILTHDDGVKRMTPAEIARQSGNGHRFFSQIRNSKVYNFDSKGRRRKCLMHNRQLYFGSDNPHEQTLFHGTTIQAALQILKEGFRDMGTRNGKSYGPGIYFTKDIHLAMSPQYATPCEDFKHARIVLVCRVLVGKRMITNNRTIRLLSSYRSGGDRSGNIIVKPYEFCNVDVAVLCGIVFWSGMQLTTLMNEHEKEEQQQQNSSSSSSSSSK